MKVEAYKVFLAVLVSACIASCSSLKPGEVKLSEPVAKSLVVYLVRHAEKAATGADPDLTLEGIERSKQLADVLEDALIEHVYSTNYIRTRKTAEPVAGRLGLEIELYDPRNLEAFASTLKESGGGHLVIGHSNTTPEMVELLGGVSGPGIDEEREFDRLYIVTVDSTGSASTVLERYGKPCEIVPPHN